ncbi:MAG: dihydroneopterin aldolase [Spirosomataceae bacterium]
MGSIALEGMSFFAYHGYYEEEQKIGNRYEVDIRIDTDLTIPAETDELLATINYEMLYACVASVMQEKHKLLEHVAREIIQKVRKKTKIGTIVVSVSKLNPPIGGVCHRARITLEGFPEPDINQ